MKTTVMTTQPRRRARRLTQRELRVLLFAAAGYTTQATAKRLGVQPETVRTQRDSCRKKLGATSIANAVALALVHNLFSQQREQQVAQIAAVRLDRRGAG